MGCVHVCLEITKLVIMLSDYLDDDACYKLGAKPTSKNTYDACEDSEIKSTRKFIITLTSAAIISRKELLPFAMSSMYIVEIPINYFLELF